MSVWQKYISMLPEGQSRQPTGVYEWNHETGFGDMICVGDIVEIPVERKLKSSPYDIGTLVLTRGVVYLAHGEFKIDINNDFSASLCPPHDGERSERTVDAHWPRHLNSYSHDYHRPLSKMHVRGIDPHNIRILGNIAENHELLVR